MKVIQKIFGHDQSKIFLASKPERSIGDIFHFAVLFASIELLIWIFYYMLQYILKFEISEDQRFAIMYLIRGISVTPLAIYYFYPNIQQLFSLLTSLPQKVVYTHALILTLLCALILFVFSVPMYIRMPAEATEVVNVFKEQPKSFIVKNEIVDNVTYFYMLLFVAFYEELIFRGGIFRILRGKLPFFLAAALTSLLFAFVHENTFESFAVRFIFSMILCGYVQYKNNLLSTIVVHYLSNVYIAGYIGYASALTAAMLQPLH